MCPLVVLRDERFVGGRREWLGVGFHDTLVATLQVLECLTDLRSVGRVGLLYGGCQKQDRVVGVGREAERTGRRHLGRDAVVEFLLPWRTILRDRTHEDGAFGQGLASSL